MKLLTHKAYAEKYGGMMLTPITKMSLEQEGFTFLGKFTKAPDSTLKVKEIVEKHAKDSGCDLAVYQAVTRKRGEYTIWIYVR